MTRVIASVLVSSLAEMLQALKERTDGADLVELRVDALADLDLDRLRAASEKPVVLTCRSLQEGGLFRGSEEERLAVLRKGLELEFDYVDVELEAVEGTSGNLRGKGAFSKILVSHHAMDAVPDDLSRLVSRAVELGADVVKLAVRSASLADAIRLSEAGKAARERGVSFIPVALGAAGIPARILACRFGADFVYAAARGLAPAGPGQLDLDELLNVYRFRAISSATDIYGILGHPAAESLSPAMHNTHFSRLGLDAVYVPFEEENLESFVSAARKLGVKGFSVTRPFKEDILPFLDEVDLEAQQVGAVNTVVARGREWIGFNTDLEGVIGPLSEITALEGKRAVVLGAGGAARAAAFGLVGRGARPTILARRAERARELASAVGGEAGSTEDVNRVDWELLINATPVGGGEQKGALPAPVASVRPGSVVLDMVYDPEETALLRTCRLAGARVISGMEMLVAQAVRQAEIWTGVAPSKEDMKRAAREERRRRLGDRLPEDVTRYSRQILFEKIGEEGQRRIRGSRVLVVGVGALGSVAAEMMVRAGVGFLRVVDRDYVDETNLHRQSLYDEMDLDQSLPKAVAAGGKLRRINREVELEERVTDLNPGNVRDLLGDVDLILDGTDNFETRYLLNDACIVAEKPWIYAACVGSYGMSFVIRPGDTPCLRCFMEEEPAPGTSPTCDTAGIIAPVVHAVAAFQVTEALKILTGREEDLLGSVLSIDVWSGRVDRFRLRQRREGCPACGERRFDYLTGNLGSRVATLCGRNAVQVRPATMGELRLDEVAGRLRTLGEVRATPYLVRFKTQGKELVLFADGRAIIHGTSDTGEARSFYTRYVGL
ncbi:MAG: shikimate dehydrogenase [Acidobacteriota bacterium]